MKVLSSYYSIARKAAVYRTLLPCGFEASGAAAGCGLMCRLHPDLAAVDLLDLLAIRLARQGAEAFSINNVAEPRIRVGAEAGLA